VLLLFSATIPPYYSAFGITEISKDHFLVKYANLQSGMKTFDLVHQRKKQNKKNEAIMNAEEESVFVLTPIGRI